MSAPSLPLDVYKVGYLKKIKTQKKKWFVLRKEAEDGRPAQLEYYDSEKKWRSGTTPKRAIVLKTCFNINRKVDARFKHVIGLYTRDDLFGIAAENEQEQQQWLNALLELQGNPDDHHPRPNFDHIWQVHIKNRGLGVSRNLVGPYRLCLTSTSLNLMKVGGPEHLEFPLMTVRRCGHTDSFFFMELGRFTITGAGELWMQTEDTVIAQNMHEAILNAMKANKASSEEFRPRSSSTSDKAIVSRRPGTTAPELPGRAYTIPGGRVRTASEGLPHASSPPTYNPNSVGSTDSMGSAISEDEFDAHHSLGTEALPTEPTITEEPPDTAASLPETNVYLNLNFQEPLNHSGSEYIEMASPVAAQSAGMGDYFNMGPAAAAATDSHHASSGYVPMAPVGAASNASTAPQEDGYLNMTPLSSSLPKSSSSFSSHYMDMTSSPQHSLASSLASSFTQEEPSHLDKVKSYFSPSEDDSDEYIKPIRTYSVGSHPQQMRKSHLAAHLEPSRTRAYSVGSQASKKRSLHPIDQELGSLKTKLDSKSSHKSSSAPLLPPPSSRRQDRSEDLMEINYNHNNTSSYTPMGPPWQASNRLRKISLGNQPKSISSDYMDMTRGDKPINKIPSIPDKLSSLTDKRLSMVSDKLTTLVERKPSIDKPVPFPLLPDKPQPPRRVDSLPSDLSGDYVNLAAAKLTAVPSPDYANLHLGAGPPPPPSEELLHYASLDLAPLCEDSLHFEPAPLVYAEIDFDCHRD